MGRSRPIKEAIYSKGFNNSKRVKATDVTDSQKNIGIFLCEDCGKEITHSGGKHPHFKLKPNTSHDIDCYYYLETVDLGSLIKEVGAGNINIKISPIDLTNNSEYELSKGRNSNTVDTIKKIGTHHVKTIKNLNKTRNFYMNKVERLFHVQGLPEKERNSIFNQLVVNKQFYSTKNHEKIISDYKNGELNHTFFAVGYLHQNEYWRLINDGIIEVTDKPYKELIRLHLKPKNEKELIKRIKEITWLIRSSDKKTAYVGLLGEITGIKEENGLNIINIEVFDLDIKESSKY